MKYPKERKKAGGRSPEERERMYQLVQREVLLNPNVRIGDLVHAIKNELGWMSSWNLVKYRKECALAEMNGEPLPEAPGGHSRTKKPGRKMGRPRKTPANAHADTPDDAPAAPQRTVRPMVSKTEQTLQALLVNMRENGIRKLSLTIDGDLVLEREEKFQI